MNTRKEPSLNHKLILRGFRFAFIPVFMTLLSIVGLLVGCQLQDFLLPNSTSTLQPSQTVEAQASLSPEKTLPAPTPETKKNTLVLWVPPEFDPAAGTHAAELFNERIDAFQREHPEIVIEVRLKSLEGQGGLLDSLSTASAAAPKALPTLIALSAKDMELAALKGHLLPLDVVYKNYSEPDWLPYATQLALVDEVHYGVPFAGDVLVMAYRPLQSPFPPASWQELSLQNLVVSFPVADPDAVTTTSLYLTAGGKLTGETGQPILQKTALLKSYAIFNDGTQTGAFPYWLSQFTTFDQSWEAFVNQQAGYSINWFSQYLKNPPANVSVNEVPKMGENQVTLAQGWSWCIPNQSVNQAYSVMLLEYFSDPAFVNAWNQAAGYVPVRRSGLTAWQGNDIAPILSSLVEKAQVFPPSSVTHVINPILESSLTQVIKLQVFYQQAVDDAINKFPE